MKRILVILGLLFSTQLWSQEYLPVEHIGMEDGLSYRDVNCIYKDSKGFMWFGTTNGLNRYDGVDWVVYKHNKKDSTSIPGNNILWIHEDSKQNLIIGIDHYTHLSYTLFDRQEERFRKIIVKNGSKTEIFTNIEFITSTNAGNIVATGTIQVEGQNDPNRISRNYWRPKKYYVFNYLESGVFEVISELSTPRQQPLPNPDSWNGEKYWIKGSNSYQIFDVQKNTRFHYFFRDFGFSGRLPIDKDGKFWYPNRSSNDGKLFDSFKVPVSIPLKDWKDFKVDNHWNIWLREKSGKIFKFDMAQKHLMKEAAFETSSFFRLRPIFNDSDGTLWHHGKYGVEKVKKRRNYFQQLFYNPLTRESDLATKRTVIYPIVQTYDGILHALSGWGQMNSINPNVESGEPFVRRIGRDKAKGKARIFSVSTVLLPAHDNRVWMYADSKIMLFNPASDEITIYPFEVDHPKLEVVGKGERNSSFQMDEAGKLWLVWGNDRLYSFDTLSKVYNLESEKIFVKGVVGIKDGQLWIGSSATLSKFDRNNKVSVDYDIPLAANPDNEVATYNVAPYRDKVWLGTRTGLVEFDPKTEQFKRYTKKEGLSSNIIYTMIPHGDYLWMGTHNGLCRFHIASKEVKNYYVVDGLTHNEFNRNAAFKGNDGKLYFGGMNGINAFDPAVLDSVARLEPSRLAWTKFSKIDGQRDTLQFRPNNQLDPSKPVELFHGDRSFTFHYALLNYLEPSQNTYYYYLENFELDWKYAENTAFTNYPILPPGEYVFRVKAKDALGNPGENELAIPLIVYGPWWSTWWARVVFVLLILAAFFAYIQWQTISLKRQKEVLEKTVKERTTELEAQKERAERSEQFKERFLANMSHEIRTPMHAISGMTNILARNKHFSHQKKFLKAIQQSAGNLLVILNDILDLSKIEAGKIEIESIPINPAIVINNVVEIMKIKAEEKGLILHTSIDESIPKYINGDATRLSQILLNLLGNAIKFTEKGMVKVHLGFIEDKLRFAIQDTGIGIPKDKLESVFGTFEQVNATITKKYGGTGLGLSITKQLVELQHGKIWVESQENIGSTFFFDLPYSPVETNKILEKQITEEQVKEMAATLTGLKILLVEDNEFNVMIASDDLSYYIKDVKIGLAENGNRAIQEFESGDFDLILMDIQMPELSGYDATKAIRKLETGGAHIPIIAMTASLLKSEIVLCYEAGMDNYIPKPYKIEELIGTIYEVFKK